MINEEYDELVINIKIPNKTLYGKSKSETSNEKQSGCILSSMENQESILKHISMILSGKVE